MQYELAVKHFARLESPVVFYAIYITDVIVDSP